MTVDAQAPVYQCAVCGQPVIVAAEAIARACGHDDAAVVANMSAHATASGTVRTA